MCDARWSLHIGRCGEVSHFKTSTCNHLKQSTSQGHNINNPAKKNLGLESAHSELWNMNTLLKHFKLTLGPCKICIRSASFGKNKIVDPCENAEDPS